ncbi:acyl-CoA thioesterase [Paenibacillus albicereus]|uniref:Acyl-CoA thioesterase n=1 Tax=Paenibacillus albicereus TaxID=2726185 RepID=A0A6H2H0W9_9BACL|nr:thioesterase family protein [Paenibacillus albicereus]QJC52998.1 acyl-CoA thioesterase [Paenibacillus albicereus]
MEQAEWMLYPLRVRYQETDAMGVVYHANYLTWFEIGRTELIRSKGYAYGRIEQEGLMLPLTDLDSQFRQPARYDDAIVVCTRVESFTPMRVGFRYQIRRLASASAEAALPALGEGTVRAAREDGEGLPGELLAGGGTRHVWVDRGFRPARLDRRLPELYELIRRMAPGGKEERA